MTAGISGAASNDDRLGDALHTRVLTELGRFTRWLKREHVKGYVGEVGWPDNYRGDASRWNGLADAWFRKADAARLWVTEWSTGEWWGTAYKLAPWHPTAAAAPTGRPLGPAESSLRVHARRRRVRPDE